LQLANIVNTNHVRAYSVIRLGVENLYIIKDYWVIKEDDGMLGKLV